ncbi:MAG TPA: hypothetical protein VKN18_00225 [Blastocatellia bacterium]|nr:hypothetical protein [Blastocatellia bacterium]
MNSSLLFVLMLIVPSFVQQKNSVTITVRNEEGRQPIADATVSIKDTDILRRPAVPEQFA